MLSFIIVCKRISDKFIQDEMSVYAAQAAFFIVLSFFPFVMVLMTLLQFIPHLSADILLTVLTALIPNVSKARPLVEGAVVAAVNAAGGMSFDDILKELEKVRDMKKLS